ncbi:MAG: phytanoyl-CoA dioxygenase family protein [Pseudomonadota bacterium]
MIQSTPIESVKEKFEEKGFVVIDSGLDSDTIKGTLADLEPYFGAQRTHPINVPYADAGRIQDAWYFSQHVYRIATAPEIEKALLAIYGEPAKPFQTLNFPTGTQQAVHADSIHFNCEPFGAMCGVWTALEDIGMDQGPLIYYPGSHKLPEMNYDFFGLKAHESSYEQYLQELEKIIASHGYTPEYGVLKQGQSLIWAANILHGGSKQLDRSLTRTSQVTHYYIGEAKPWRPVHSRWRRAYFRPDWVRDTRGEKINFKPKSPFAWRQQPLQRLWFETKQAFSAQDEP